MNRPIPILLSQIPASSFDRNSDSHKRHSIIPLTPLFDKNPIQIPLKIEFESVNCTQRNRTNMKKEFNLLNGFKKTYVQIMKL